MCLVWNLGHGPFNSGAWDKGMLEAAADMMQNLQPSDGLMVWLGARLEAESQSGMALDLEPVLTKGPRVSLSRWFSFYDATNHHWKFWFTKLAILLYTGVQAGQVTNANDFPLPVADLQGPARVAAPQGKDAAEEPLHTEAAAETPCAKEVAEPPCTKAVAEPPSTAGHTGKAKRQKAAPAASTRAAGKSSEESTALG